MITAIATERLLLNPTSINDADFLFELMNSPKWLEYIGNRNIHSVEDARRYIQQKIIPQFDRLGYGNYTVTRKSDGIKIGCCGLYDRDGLVGIDIGFAFMSAYEGKGYAFEAASKLIQLAFQQFGLDQLLAITAKHDTASQRLLKKLGLHEAGVVHLQNDKKEVLLFKTDRLET